MKKTVRNRTIVPILLTGAALLLLMQSGHSQQAGSGSSTNLLSATLAAKDAGPGWLELRQAMQQPPVPPQWQTKPPTPEEQKKFLLPYVLAASGKAHDFYTKFPTDVNASTAKQYEYDMLALAIQFGATNLESRLDALEKSMLADPNLTADDRFTIRQHSVERAAARKEAEGAAAAMAELEKGIRALQKEFPGRAEVTGMLLEVASNSDSQKAKELLKEIISSDAPAQIKEAAQALATKLEAVGKPLLLQFTAVDGRTVDLSAMKGKVVLVDFWATWCMPCLGELPHVKEAFQQLHSKGFEIVGISLDNDIEKLKTFTKENQMSWPQFCDGRGWQNKYAEQFGVTSIPAMWLVDKKGALRDMNARADLRQKIEKMLAE